MHVVGIEDHQLTGQQTGDEGVFAVAAEGDVAQIDTGAHLLFDPTVAQRILDHITVAGGDEDRIGVRKPVFDPPVNVAEHKGIEDFLLFHDPYFAAAALHHRHHIRDIANADIFFGTLVMDRRVLDLFDPPGEIAI